MRLLLRLCPATGTHYINSVVKEHWFYAIVDVSNISTTDEQILTSSFKQSGSGYGVRESVSVSDLDRLQQYMTSHSLTFHYDTSDGVKPFPDNPAVKDVWAEAQAVANRHLSEGNPKTVAFGLGSYGDIGVVQPLEIENTAGRISELTAGISDLNATEATLEDFLNKPGDFVLPANTTELMDKIHRAQSELEQAISERYDIIGSCRNYLDGKSKVLAWLFRLRQKCLVDVPKHYNVSLAFLPGSLECNPDEAAPSASPGGGGCIRAERNAQGTCLCTECGFVRNGMEIQSDDKIFLPNKTVDQAKGTNFECRGMPPGADAVVENHFVLSAPIVAEIGVHLTHPEYEFTQAGIYHLRVDQSEPTKVPASGTTATRVYNRYCWYDAGVSDICTLAPDESGYGITIRTTSKH